MSMLRGGNEKGGGGKVTAMMNCPVRTAVVVATIDENILLPAMSVEVTVPSEEHMGVGACEAKCG